MTLRLYLWVPEPKPLSSSQRLSDRTLRPPNAIRLACTAAGTVNLFITNDARLGGKRVEGIEFIAALERAPL